MRFFNQLALSCLIFANTAVAELRYSTVDGVDGVPLQVVTSGDPSAPAILFIHGIGQSHYMFREQLRSSLADDYYLVAFDLRGHGASGKPWEPAAYGSAAVWAGDIAAVLDAAGARQPLVVAWSFGTIVAMDFLRERGLAAISGLVLTGSTGALVPVRMPEADDSDTAEFLEVRRLQSSADPGDRVRAAGRMVDWLVAEPLAAADREVLMATTFMFPAYARQAIYARSYDNSDLVPVVETIPTLIAVGSEDNPLMVEDAGAFAAGRPSVELSLYEGAGHSVFFEVPERFNRELRAHARRSFGDTAQEVSP